MKHNYEERRQHRIAYAKQKAIKKEKEAETYNQQADRVASFIPPGQPILIGHHSEKRHRRDLDRIHNSMKKAIDANEKAAYYEDRVKAMEGNTAISSDNPQAIEKLQAKVEKLSQLQEFMKAANKCIRKKDKDGFLKLAFGTEQLWEQLNKPDFAGRIGFADYKLKNNNANIRRIKERVESLKGVAGRTTKETVIKGIRVVENTEANRVQLIFPGKPEKEIRQKLKQAGFHWCQSEGAWQRFLNNSGIYAAKNFLENLKD